MTGGVPAADAGPRAVGVLLAAGTSTRFGDANKLLADLDGRPVVRHAAERLVESPVDAAAAVLGHDADRVSDALDGLPIATVRNPDYRRGQGTSVACGATWAADQGADAAVFALGDMPCVDAATYERLLAAVDGSAAVAVPVYDGQRGNPVVFGADHFPALRELEGDEGGRAVFADADVTRVAVDDPGIRRDVDTPGDLDNLR